MLSIVSFRRRSRIAGLFAVVPLMLATSVYAADEGYSVKWKNGLHINSPDGQFKLKLGGRTYLDFASVSGSESIKAMNGATGTGVEFRTARLYAAGTLFGRLAYKSQFDFAPGAVTLKDVYIALKKVPAVGTVKVGHFKEPFGLEELTSSRFITFMERALPATFAPSRNVGIQVGNTAADKRVTWAIGGFRNYGSNGKAFGVEGEYNITGRVTAAPLYSDDGAQVVHVGFAYSHQFRNANAAVPEYKVKPETHMTTEFLPKGKLASDGVDLIGAELAAVFGPASLQGEYMMSMVKPASGDRANLNGFYVEGSFFLTGEHRNYSRKKGAFGRINVKNNFDPGSGGWGAWQVAARFSRVDLEHRWVNNGKLQDISGGVNWYLFPNCRVMANYIYSKVLDGGGRAHIAQMRAQIDF